MKWFVVLGTVLATAAHADMSATGFVEALAAQRVDGGNGCGAVKACPELANEQRLRVLLEGRTTWLAATLRADLWNDVSLANTRAETNEAFLDLLGIGQGSLRVGRQVVTWGTGEYLYVNDIFPKNYDRFFRGHSFDALKDAVDGMKAGWSFESADVELVVSRPRPDHMPEGRRYVGASAMPIESLPQEQSGTDVALKMSTRLSSFDVAGYAGRYRSRTQSIAMAGAGPTREGAPVSHVGASVTGNVAGGVVWAEVAHLSLDVIPGNMNRFAAGSRVKTLLGYSRELSTDVTATAQIQTEHDTDRQAYVQSLAPGVRPLKRDRVLGHLRVHARLVNQTVGLGLQGFFGQEGDRHINPFASYTPLDGLNFELGANLFYGRADTQYGALSDDSNVYLSARYSY